MKCLMLGSSVPSTLMSPPTRGAWVEISLVYAYAGPFGVAPHTGGVG